MAAPTSGTGATGATGTGATGATGATGTASTAGSTGAAGSRGAARGQRRRLFDHPWRVAVVAVALVAVLNLGILVLATSDTTAPGTGSLPTTVDSVSPAAAELTTLVDDVTVDLRDDLTGVIILNGVEIPEDQLERVDQLGIVTFRPGEDKEFTKLRAGENTVVVEYWPRTKSRPADPGTYSWRFRAAA